MIPLSDFWLSVLTNSVPVRLWNGLSAECCRVLNLPLSTENLAAANRSLRWTFVQRYPEGASGEEQKRSLDEWFTFVLKVLEDSKADCALTHNATTLSLGLSQASSLTRLIFSSRQTPQPSTALLFNGDQ